jgi:hypothetical protein
VAGRSSPAVGRDAVELRLSVVAEKWFVELELRPSTMRLYRDLLTCYRDAVADRSDAREQSVRGDTLGLWETDREVGR